LHLRSELPPFSFPSGEGKHPIREGEYVAHAYGFVEPVVLRDKLA